MYTNIRLQTIPRPLFLTSLLVASLLVGGAAGYSLATVPGLSATPQNASEQQAQGSRPNQITTFLAAEHQGSSENPNAAVTSAPGNITFLANEHQGSRENPDASK